MLAGHDHRIPPTPKNDPRLFEKVRLRVLKPFCVDGQRIDADTILELPRYVARDLVVLGKAISVS